MKEFAAAAREWSSAYATDHILMPMGEDFNYVSARTWYKNLDKLIYHMNRKNWDDNAKPIHLVYSTPSCYLKSLHDSGKKWPTKSDDFFPYASDPHAYWTGYFTSRPTIKGMVRYGNNFLQVCKQIDALANRYGLQQCKLFVKERGHIFKTLLQGLHPRVGRRS